MDDCNLEPRPYRDLLPKLPNTPLSPATLYNKPHFLIQLCTINPPLHSALYNKLTCWLLVLLHLRALSPGPSFFTCMLYMSALSSLPHCPVRPSPKPCRSQHLGYVTHNLFINSCCMANTALLSWPFELSRILSSLHQRQGILFGKIVSEFTSVPL